MMELANSQKRYKDQLEALKKLPGSQGQKKVFKTKMSNYNKAL